MPAAVRGDAAPLAIIGALAPDETDRAADLLAAAFDDDPTALRFRDRGRRRRVLGVLARAALHDAVDHGRVRVVRSDDALLGVAVWYPPGSHPPSVLRLLRTFVPAGLRLLRVDPLTAVLAVPSILRDGRRWASRRAWYLQAIAVAPEARRRGIGGTLVTDGLAVSDARGEGCYLRTSHLATIAWYEGFGFEVIDPPIHVDASRRVRMRRRARIGQVVRVRERAG